LRGVAIVLIALGLTGCIGPSSTTTADVAELPQAPVAVASAINNSSAVEAPAWKAGDAWETTTRGAGNGRGTLVVASASSDSYLLATDNPTLAGYDAMYDVSYVGRVRASDLAGAQRDKPVQFFAFPMKNGALWSTTWDGAQVVMSATFTPSIPTAGGAPGFAIVATKDGKAYATYDYVPALKWWSHLDFAEG
jgi:hypothetical protein